MGTARGVFIYWDLLRVGGWLGEGIGRWGGWGGITLGEMPNVDDGRMETANHHDMCVPVQQSCKICTRTPELKVQFKKILVFSP